MGATTLWTDLGDGDGDGDGDPNHGTNRRSISPSQHFLWWSLLSHCTLVGASGAQVSLRPAPCQLPRDTRIILISLYLFL